ncbi:MAG: RNA-binding S4 domain-containing protein [Bacteroidales bacterium]|nr:RNA-binding S4 domain-containing protein [Bacteroidales bacterium]
MDSVRIDKYLWAIRVYKTRSEACDACSGNKVRINGTVAKPSKAVKIGDLVEVHKGPASLTYKVLQLSENRMGAQLVPEYAEDKTPESERAKLHAPKETVVLRRDKGAGRPTKKDRRTLDALREMLDE